VEERIKRLMSTVKCGHCGQPYSSHNVRVIGQTNGLWYVNAYCTACQSQFVIAATLSDENEPLISDLTAQENARAIKRTIPTADDILDMHSFLKDFNGNFANLFGRQKVGG
jgi:hypothetical protein